MTNDDSYNPRLPGFQDHKRGRGLRAQTNVELDLKQKIELLEKALTEAVDLLEQLTPPHAFTVSELGTSQRLRPDQIGDFEDRRHRLALSQGRARTFIVKHGAK